MTLIIKNNTIPEIIPKSQPMGGTEILHAELKKRLDPSYWNKINLIVGKITEDYIIPDKVNLLWIHDNVEDPGIDSVLVNKELLSKLDKLIFVSYWQMESFVRHYSLSYDKCAVIKNAINPVKMEGILKDPDICRFIYTSTPHRGLDVLFEAINILSTIDNRFKVDIFSSFKIYGWDEMQEKNQHVFDKIAEHPNVVFHGYQSNDRVRELLQRSHCMAYPNVYLETYCLAMVEAMSAKNFVITPAMGALPEISSGFADLYIYEPDKRKHSELIALKMFQFMNLFYNNYSELAQLLNLQKIVVDGQNNWDSRQVEWNNFLSQYMR